MSTIEQGDFYPLVGTVGNIRGCLRVEKADSNLMPARDPAATALYPVRFTENGLPSALRGAAWSVALNGATDGVVERVPVGSYPEGAAYDGANGNVYVADERSANVTVINGATDTVVGSVPVGLGPGDVVYDSANGYVYVANEVSDNVSVINGATDNVIDSIPADRGDTWLDAEVYDAANGYVYVANFYSNDVVVIDGTTDSIVGSVTVGEEPSGLAYDSANGYVYVAAWYSNNLTVIDGSTDEVVGSIPVGSLSAGVAFDPANRCLYVIHSFTPNGNVTVINGSTDSVVGSIGVGAYPVGVVYDDATGSIYVANEGSGDATIINGTTDTAVGSVPVSSGTWPQGLAYDSANRFLYVADGSGNVTVINGAVENWTTPTVVFMEPNGTYSYTVGSFSGWSANPSSGMFAVSGAQTSLTITFAQNSTGPSSSTPAARFLGLPGADGYYLLGAISAVVITTGVGAGLRSRGHRARPPVGPSNSAASVPPAPPPSV